MTEHQPEAGGRPRWLVPLLALLVLFGLGGAFLFFTGNPNDDSATDERSFAPLDGEEQWRIPSPFGSSPAIVGSDAEIAIFVGADDCGNDDCDLQRVAVVDHADGAVLWTQAFEGGAVYQPGGIVVRLMGDLVLVKPDSVGAGDLIAFEATNGNERWRVEVGETWLPNQLVQFGDLVVAEGANRDRVLALNLETGVEQWSYDGESDDDTETLRVDSIASDVIVLRRTLRGDDGPVSALQAVDSEGSPMWARSMDFPHGGVMQRGPVGATRVRISWDGGQVQAFDVDSGDVLWTHTQPGLEEIGGRSRVVVDHEQGRATVFSLQDRTVVLHAVDLSSGEQLWNKEISMPAGQNRGEPWVLTWSASTAIVTSSNSLGDQPPIEFIAVDLENGNTLWQRSLGTPQGAVLWNPVLEGNEYRVGGAATTADLYVVISGVDGKQQLDLRTGDVEPIGDPQVSVAAISDNQTLRVETTEGSTLFQVVGTDTQLDVGPSARPIAYLQGILFASSDDELVAMG